MSLDEGILETAAKDGSIDYDKWPGLLDPLLERLDHIVHHEFPLPRTTQHSSYETVPTQPLASPSHTQEHNSQANSNKENAPPSQLLSPPRPPPVPLFSSPSSSLERVPDSQPPSGPAEDGLPPPISSMLSAVKSTLKTTFPKSPPYTIQRLAELILRPTAHYRTLPAYLRALDRIVSVSSGADIFPLPRVAPLPGTTGDGTTVDNVNGIGTGSFMFSDSSLGSDESLGGALLTPIPWLSNSAMAEDESDAFAEAHAVPPHQSENTPEEPDAEASSETTNQQQQQQSSGVRGQSPDSEDSESVPHPRGPPLLGVEDLGLQNGKGVEMTLDTKSESPSSSSADANNQTQDQDAPSEVDADADAEGDVMITDAQEKGDNTQDEDGKESEKNAPTDGGG